MLHVNDSPSREFINFFHLFHVLSAEKVREMTGKDRRKVENSIGDLSHLHEHQGTSFD